MSTSTHSTQVITCTTFSHQMVQTVLRKTCHAYEILGDFSIHIHDPDDSDSRRFCELLSSFDMLQHVTAATHCCGGTLDLVMTFDGALINEVRVDPPILSDHSLVICALAVAERLVRGWRLIDRDQLRRAIEDSALCQPRCTDDDDDVDELFATYDRVMRDIVDQLAPLRTARCRTGSIAPWFDADCCSARRECRRLERRYLRTRTTDDRRRWVDAARRLSRLYRAKKVILARPSVAARSLIFSSVEVLVVHAWSRS